MAIEFREESVLRFPRGMVFGKTCRRNLKVTCISQAIRADGAEFWKLEVTLVELENVSSYWTMRKGDVVADAAGNHTNLVGTNEDRTEFGTDVEDSMLKNDEEVAVCAIEGRVCIH